MPLALSIGSGPVTLVQQSSMTNIFYGRLGTTDWEATATFNSKTTPGTCLIAAFASGVFVSGAGTGTTGWVRPLTVQQGLSGVHLEIWAYQNNPGGISSATF